MVVAYSDKHTESKRASCWKNAELFTFKQSGTYSYHSVQTMFIR